MLDISAGAIVRAKKRLGEKASEVHWIISDITESEPQVQFNFWHHRAAFHFLTTENKIYKYICIPEDGIKQNGYLNLVYFQRMVHPNVVD